MKREWREIKGECLACGHGNDRERGNWCSASADGLVILCRRRAEGGVAVRQRDGATARLFRVADLQGGGMPVKTKQAKVVRKLTTAEVAVIVKQHRSAVNPRRLARLAEKLGLRVPSLVAFGIGWETNRGVWTFPMYDGSRDSAGCPRPCGLRVRNDAGDKWSVSGSREGLFLPDDFVETAEIPAGLCADSSPLAVLMPEGPTDCAAARDMGCRAIGRPHNKGGADQLMRLLLTLPPQDMVIVGEWDGPNFNNAGEADFPGIGGALHVAERILGLSGRVRLMMPPKGVKDLRAWLPTAKAGELLACIHGATRVTAGALPSMKDRLKLLCKQAERARKALGR